MEATQVLSSGGGNAGVLSEENAALRKKLASLEADLTAERQQCAEAKGTAAAAKKQTEEALAKAESSMQLARSSGGIKSIYSDEDYQALQRDFMAKRTELVAAESKTSMIEVKYNAMEAKN